MPKLRCTHIAKLTEEITRIVRDELDGADIDSPSPLTPDSNRQLERVMVALERMDNLYKHARAEIDDEVLRARDGWPVV